MKSFQKIYVLVGMVSLLYGGISLANFFPSRWLSKSSIVDRKENKNTNIEDEIQKFSPKNKKFHAAVALCGDVEKIELQGQELTDATLDYLDQLDQPESQRGDPSNDDWYKLEKKGKDYLGQLNKMKIDLVNMLNVLKKTKYYSHKKRKKEQCNQMLQSCMIQLNTKLDELSGRQKQWLNLLSSQRTSNRPFGIYELDKNENESNCETE